MTTALLLTPLAGGLVLLLIPPRQVETLRRTALAAALATLGLALLLAWRFDPRAAGAGGFQFETRADWIPALGIGYHVGVDALSLPLVLLTALVVAAAVLASWNIVHRAKEYFVLLLLLEVGLLGVFVALDLILFYVFFEVVLVPMYFLIGIWGSEDRRYAAVKFFIYTLLGSLIFLVGIFAIHFLTVDTLGVRTFDIPELTRIFPRDVLPTLGPGLALLIFLAFFFGFGVKVPVVPFHTWLPDAHVQAPTAGSMVLAGVLLKMGAYGFYRIAFPLLPDAAQAMSWVFGLLGAMNITYGALAAMAQSDLKKLVAYSSISHMGFAILGLAALTPATLQAGLFVLVSHGLISPLLFFFVGSVFYDRLHTREMPRMGGLLNAMPVAAVLFMVAGFANLGLPGLSGFVGEFLTLAGAWGWNAGFVTFSAVGLVIVAAYHIWMFQRALMGEPGEALQGHTFPDISARELVVALPLLALVIYLGVAPGGLLALLAEGVKGMAGPFQAGNLTAVLGETLSGGR